MSNTDVSAVFPGNNLPVAIPAGPFQSAWYFLLQALFVRTGSQTGVNVVTVQDTADGAQALAAMSVPIRGTSKPPLISVTVGASPYEYVAPFAGDVVVDAGTVSAVEFSRDGTNFITYPAGIVAVAAGDIVRVTYSTAPTMTMVGSEQWR